MNRGIEVPSPNVEPGGCLLAIVAFSSQTLLSYRGGDQFANPLSTVNVGRTITAQSGRSLADKDVN
jgi:hypothetical protein